MSEDLGLSIAQSLTAIVILYRDLEDEALHRFADKDIPGGDALVMLGPVANMEAYNYRQLSELMGRTNAKAGYDDPDTDDAPPLLVLASWHDVVRQERGLPDATKRATITREADGIRASIDWMLAQDERGTQNFMPADELAKDLKRVIYRLERILKAGEREDRIRAECKACSHAPRLCVKPGVAADKSDDSWYCPSCERPYDSEGVAACWRQMFVRWGDAPEWIRLRQAAAAIKRPVSTVRTWTLAPLDSMDRPKVDRHGNPKPPRVESQRRPDGRTWVRWSDVRAVEDTTHRRGRNRIVA